MAELSPGLLPLTASSTLDAGAPNTVPVMYGQGNLSIVHGIELPLLGSDVRYVHKYVGEKNVPADIQRQRRYTLEMMRRMGTPVVIKKMLTDADVRLRAATESPNFHNVYGQVRNNDDLSHGVGFVSVEKSENEYLSVRGEIFTSDEDPGSEFQQAPKYRGFGPGYLTYVIEPDVTEDFYKHTPEGVFVRVQQAMAVACFWPDINDNDLIIHVTLDERGDIKETRERYQAKMVNPVSIRGLDRRGRREYAGDFGNRYVINQQFQMTLLPENHQLYKVEVDR